MLNGLDLFSGIGGLSLALRDWVRPVAYCEIDKFCQAVLLSRMAEGRLPKAPISENICEFAKEDISGNIDIIYGGFPCQDISIAGHGKGLAGKRSGLFYQIVRLCSEIRPRFIFLENVPAITARGGLEVVKEITSLGYDCRWCVISASSVGAMHKRERWFLLAYSNSPRQQKPMQSKSIPKEDNPALCKSFCNTDSQPSKQADTQSISNTTSEAAWRRHTGQYWPFESRAHWQETVSSMGKCSDGVQFHVDRLRALGNSVVPQQVKEAFKILMGFKV